MPRLDIEEPAVGRGFEVELGKFWFNPETEKWVRWHERYLVVHSHSFATGAIRGLQQRLDLAQTALEKLADKPRDDLELLNQKVEAILKRHRVNKFFSVTTTLETFTETRHLGRGRPTAKSPKEHVTRVHLQLPQRLI